MQEWERLLVASLFHDIGKFWQRTGDPVPSRFAEMDDTIYGKNGKHACWSAGFITHWLPHWEEAVWPALTHHLPQDRIAKLIAVADQLSASERDDHEDSEAGGRHRGGGQVWGAQQPGQRQLQSVFSRVKLGDATGVAPSFIRLNPLQVERAILFPQPQPLTQREETQAYRNLWQNFTAEVSQVPASLSFDAQFTTLLALLQKYTWCVPSAYYQTLPDISLYDHSRITCALAAALYRSNIPESMLDALLARPATTTVLAEAPVAILAGDLTGIQRFLYTITSSGAARSLRGRSFALQLATEAVARWIVRQLQLPLTNILYTGGGRFYLITQRLSEQRLNELRRTLDRMLLATYAGDLYLALAHYPVSFHQLKDQRGEFSAVWHDLHYVLSQEKQRKFGALPPDEQAQTLFAPFGTGGPEQLCSSCRHEIIGQPIREDDIVLCSRCQSFRDLGDQLSRARWLFLREVAPALPSTEQERARYAGLLQGLGIELQLIDAEHPPRTLANRGPGTLLRLDATDFLTGPALDIAEASGTISLGFALIANVVPLDANHTVVDFEHIAANANGIPALSVLRMDVDNLGAIFSQGLGERATLSRLASLSTFLRLFFEGWLAALARAKNTPRASTHRPAHSRKNTHHAHVYVVYSGGDDLFIVGAWDIIPTLALEIRNDFTAYTGNNPALHLSAGIALVPVTHPLYRSADDAKAALEAAKQRQEGGRVVKDAVTFLGQTVSWPTFERACQRVATLVALIEQDGVPRSLIQTLRAIAQSYHEARQAAQRTGQLRPGQQVYGRWMWQAAYTLSRAARNLPAPTAQKIEHLREELTNVTASEPIETLAMVSRWAELRTRKGEDQ